jgi:hypothetical protein
MQAVVRNVRDLRREDRTALERIVGQDLRDDQRLIIRVTESDTSEEGTAVDSRPPQALADWTSVYEGLSEDEVAAIDRVVKSRANLSRRLP